MLNQQIKFMGNREYQRMIAELAQHLERRQGDTLRLIIRETHKSIFTPAKVVEKPSPTKEPNPA